MIASLRGLAVLAAIAAALGVAVLAAGSRERASVDRTLVPGLSADQVTALDLEPTGAPAIRIIREGRTWRWHEPPGVADETTIDALLAALRGARWHRRASKAAAGTTTAVLRVSAGGQVATLAIGAPLPGSAQTWIVRGEHAFLVDSWVAAALAPEPVSLRVRHPLAGAPSAKSIAVSSERGELGVEGTRRVKPDVVWIDPSFVAAARGALAALEIVALGPARPDPSASYRVVLDGAARLELALAGTCESKTRELVYAKSPLGDGCVERASWTAMTSALDALGKPAAEIADRRPLPIEPRRITLADGAVIDLDARPQVSTPARGAGPADLERVRELVAALTAPAELVARPRSTPTGSMSAVDASGVEVILDLHDGVLARRGEPFALSPTHAHARTLARSAAAYRDPTLWREDETTITEIVLDGVTYRRGAVLGEWTRTPPGEVDAALVDALASSLASVRAPPTRWRGATAHRITVSLSPPAGAPSTHAIELGEATAGGCLAKVDGAPVVLPLSLCTAAWALLK